MQRIFLPEAVRKKEDKRKTMNIQILELIEGAKKAKGLTVIIDVFRAFSLECYLFARGAERIYPVGDMEIAKEYKQAHPEYVLIGERGGAKYPGCDFGNSPSQTRAMDMHKKCIIHTTSAGTQGVANAAGAEEIITGSLVNAKAVAEYIRKKQPETVSLVCMGNGGVSRAQEDVLCAKYIRSLLLEEPFDIEEKIKELRYHGGEHFFRADTQETYPEEDFFLCTDYNKFSFVIQVVPENTGIFKSIKKEI